MSLGVVFEEAGFNGSFSGLSRQNAAHVDPGVTCSALPYRRNEIEKSSKITSGVILGEGDEREWNGIEEEAVPATSPAWHSTAGD